MSNLLPSRAVYRIVRPARSFPFVCEFYALRYAVEIYAPPYNGGRVCIIGRLWDEPADGARVLISFDERVADQRFREGFHVDVGSIADVIFLRLMRQGDFEEMTGPHQNFQVVYTPEMRAKLEAYRRANHAVG